MAPQKRMSLWRAVHMAAFQVLACILVVIARVIYVYGATFWQSNRAINFIAAWIPALIGLVVAFVPDKDLERHMRLRWRLTVATCFVLWSVALWHQQTLTEKSDNKDREALVAAAVKRSNDHADDKFHDVQQDVGKVHDEIGDVRQHVDATEKDLTAKLADSTSVLNANIGMVGKPDAPEPAKLQFSLWKEGILDTEFPLKQASAEQQSDGSYEVRFMVKNISHVQAEMVELWVYICDLCSFAKEPAGFDNPAGNPKSVRHRMMQGLNPGTTIGDNNIDFKVQSPGVSNIVLMFKSTCKNCGAVETSEQYFVHLNPSATQNP